MLFSDRFPFANKFSILIPAIAAIILFVSCKDTTGPELMGDHNISYDFVNIEINNIITDLHTYSSSTNSYYPYSDYSYDDTVSFNYSCLFSFSTHNDTVSVNDNLLAFTWQEEPYLGPYWYNKKSRQLEISFNFRKRIIEYLNASDYTSSGQYAHTHTDNEAKDDTYENRILLKNIPYEPDSLGNIMIYIKPQNAVKYINELYSFSNIMKKTQDTFYTSYSQNKKETLPDYIITDSSYIKIELTKLIKEE